MGRWILMMGSIPMLLHRVHPPDGVAASQGPSLESQGVLRFSEIGIDTPGEILVTKVCKHVA